MPPIYTTVTPHYNLSPGPTVSTDLSRPDPVAFGQHGLQTEVPQTFLKHRQAVLSVWQQDEQPVSPRLAVGQLQQRHLQVRVVTPREAGLGRHGDDWHRVLASGHEPGHVGEVRVERTLPAAL